MSRSLRRVRGERPSRLPGTDPRWLQKRLRLVRQVRSSRFSTLGISDESEASGDTHDMFKQKPKNERPALFFSCYWGVSF